MGRWLLIGFIAALLQGFLLAPLGVAPNLLVAVVVLSALWQRTRNVFFLGLFCGFWLDVIAQQFFGTRLLFFAALAGLIWFLKQRAGLELSRAAVLAALVAALSAVYGLSFLGLIWLKVGPIWPPGFLTLLAYTAALSGAFALVLKPALKLIVGAKRQHHKGVQS